MEIQEYNRIFDLENTHAWYRELHKLILSILQTHLRSKAATILDAGCGTGGLLNQCRKTWTSSWGLDISENALKYCKKRGLYVLRGSVSHLPIKDNYFDAITCIDVIYHKNVENDKEVLQECWRVLKPSGILILHVPAFSFLKRPHDLIVHTRRRYTQASLSQLISHTDLQILKISYRNAPTFPLALRNRLFAGQGSDLKPLSNTLNYILQKLLQMESRMLKYCNMPFGSSVFCVAQKADATQKNHTLRPTQY